MATTVLKALFHGIRHSKKTTASGFGRNLRSLSPIPFENSVDCMDSISVRSALSGFDLAAFEPHAAYERSGVGIGEEVER